MLHDDYLCLVESGEQQIIEVRRKFNRKNLETKATPKRVWIRPTPPPLSRDERIKMKKSEIKSALSKVISDERTSKMIYKNRLL